ncbi:MAG: hypothetical protein JNL40_17135 [Cyclobacteriaceae bacterium]|nr:hypothetical protein [Cyclobacteriaceae bacterium]
MDCMYQENSKNLIRWLPRLLTLAMAAFLSLFSLDVFSERDGFFKTLSALFIHLIPVGLILIVLWVSWRRPLIGAIFFPVLAIAQCIASWGHWDVIGLIALPLLLIGGSYAVSYRLLRSHHPHGLIL